MNLNVGEVDGVTVIETVGRLDTATAPDLEQAGGELIDAGVTRIVLDLSRLEYLSSAGLRVILALAKRLQASGGELVMCGAAGLVRETLELAGIVGIVPLCATLDDALGGST